ncbi:MAG: hypothetical protein DRJ47_04370 [Thermoprotei archaeon]|nr:MAG: hypothetical protein DRJ47_04370 [Thermoprotei archaeon]
MSEPSEETISSLIARYRGYMDEDNYVLFESFMSWLANQGLRPSTRYRYAGIIGYFLAWLSSRNIKISDLKVKDIDLYLSSVHGKGLKHSTVHWYVVGVKKLLRYLYYITDDEKYKKLYKKIKTPRLNKSLPEILSPEEVLKIITNFSSLKYKALYALIYETGCRIGEALNLKIKHLVEDEYGFKVFFSRSKSEARAVRLVVFAGLIKKWLSIHPERDNPEAYLFFGRHPLKKMSRSAALKNLKKAALKAGIKKNVHPHIFRHTRATELYRMFKELELMKWFGWKTRRMIDVYSKITQEEVETVYVKNILNEKKHSLSEEEKTGKTCPKCGRISTFSSKYCHFCGTPL